MFDSCKTHEFGYDFGENCIIDGRRTFGRPDKALKPVSGVHDVVVHLRVVLALDRDVPVLIGLQIHEHQGCKLEPMHDYFHTGPGVSSACPGLFLIGDGKGVDLERAQELVTEFQGPVLPVNLIARAVEGMVRHHFKGCKVAPAPAHRVQVV